MGWQGTQTHATYAATKHQQLLLLPPPRMDHASPPLAAAIAVTNCAFVASPPPALRSLHLSSTYSGVEVLSFFYQKKRRAGHGRAQAAGDGGIAGGEWERREERGDG
jgi:hypothetical protein